MDAAENAPVPRLDSSGGSPRSWFDRAPRVAYVIFGLAAATSVGLYLHYGRAQWFFLDEWDFLVTREATNPDSLLKPHNEHWATLPIILYRLLWSWFGLHSYLPYQLLTIGANVVIGVLLLIVMRRAGASAWIASGAASLYLLLGSAAENVIWGFQIAFTGAVLLGLVQLLLADHDGADHRRDALAVLAGLGALMCSGVGPAMVAGVGVAVLLRRGWRAAAVQVVPLAGVYLLWLFAYGRDGVQSADRGSFTAMVSWAIDAFAATLEALGGAWPAGIATAGILVVGLRLASTQIPSFRLTSRGASTVGLLASSLCFVAASAFGRASLFPEIPGRYIGVLAALCLPAVAVAATAVARRWAVTAPLLVALFVIGTTVNVLALADYEQRNRGLLGIRDGTLVAATVAAQADLHPPMQPYPGLDADFIGWLRDGVASGAIPQVDDLSASARARTEFGLILQQTDLAADTSSCVPATGQRVDIAPSDMIAFRGGVLRVIDRDPDAERFSFREFSPDEGGTIVAYGDRSIALFPVDPEAEVYVCLP